MYLKFLNVEIQILKFSNDVECRHDINFVVIHVIYNFVGDNFYILSYLESEIFILSSHILRI